MTAPSWSTAVILAGLRNFVAGRFSRIIPIISLMTLLAACMDDSPEPMVDAAPGFVGSAACESCHAAEFGAWQKSHHALAMQEATENSVLGDFSNVSVDYFDAETRFFKRGHEFFVQTQNAIGENEIFKVSHTFGVWPLQQYLVDAPGGRKQALQFSWDARHRSQGGQRWFHLYADDYLGPGDRLHWTGRDFNWNSMCAECHSTNLVAGYDLLTDSFATDYSEVSVGCEACHGPGSRHIDQSQSGTLDAHRGLLINLDERNGVSWLVNPESGIAERSIANVEPKEVEACGRCHSRRRNIASQYEYGKPLAETHLPELLEEGLYFADGQIQDEVFVYGSFIQSKMYSAGVTCSDCHEPHSGKLKAGENPNDTCSMCHLKKKFDTVMHRQAVAGTCVDCHMPETVYMGVDGRRDHSFRLPNTDTDPNHYGSIIAAGRAGNANADLLDGIQDKRFPPIARATMLSLLETLDAEADQEIATEQLDDSDPLVRIGALRAVRQQTPGIAMRRGSHLLRDPVRAVRIEAAITYAGLRDILPREDARAFASAAQEYRNALTSSAASPVAAIGLAEFENRLGNASAAEKMFDHAIRIGANDPRVQYAYGLHLVRGGKGSKALDHLKSAVELSPDSSQFVYVYGVALNSLGQSDEAVRLLSDARMNFPDSFEIGWALTTIQRDMGDLSSARQSVALLKDAFPENPDVLALEKLLKQECIRIRC